MDGTQEIFDAPWQLCWRKRYRNFLSNSAEQRPRIEGRVPRPWGGYPLPFQWVTTSLQFLLDKRRECDFASLQFRLAYPSLISEHIVACPGATALRRVTWSPSLAIALMPSLRVSRPYSARCIARQPCGSARSAASPVPYQCVSARPRDRLRA